MGSRSRRSGFVPLHTPIRLICGAPVCRSKVLAEQKAFEMCRQQSQWSLVTILPSVVQGPPPGMPLITALYLISPFELLLSSPYVALPQLKSHCSKLARRIYNMPLHQELPRELACLRQSLLRNLQ